MKNNKKKTYTVFQPNITPYNDKSYRMSMCYFYNTHTRYNIIIKYYVIITICN